MRFARRRGLAVTQRLSPRVLFHAAFVHTFPRATLAFTLFRASGRVGADRNSVWRQRMQETARQAARLDSFTSVSCFELQSYMVNTLLRDTDAVSMANSLEVRVPFLDHRLVEFVARLPKAAKCRSGVPKALLVEALSDVLPDDVVGQSKRTFTFPWEVWLRGPLGVRLSQDLANLTPAVARIHEPASRAWRVAELRHWSDQLVASLEPLRAQRVGAASPDRRGDGTRSSAWQRPFAPLPLPAEQRIHRS